MHIRDLDCIDQTPQNLNVRPVMLNIRPPGVFGFKRVVFNHQTSCLDHQTHLFSYPTGRNNHQTGCLDHQTDRFNYPTHHLEGLSTINQVVSSVEQVVSTNAIFRMAHAWAGICPASNCEMEATQSIPIVFPWMAMACAHTRCASPENPYFACTRSQPCTLNAASLRLGVQTPHSECGPRRTQNPRDNRGCRIFCTLSVGVSAL